MKKLFSLLALLGLFLFATPVAPASAADLRGPAVVDEIGPPAVNKFSCNVSAGIGLGVTTATVSGPDIGVNLRGAQIPVGVGCNYLVTDHVSLGAFADYTFGRMSSTMGDLNGQIRGGLLIGYNLTPALMAYGKIGYAEAKSVVAGSNTTTLSGIPLGGGLEFQFQTHQAFRLEYMHTDWRDSGYGFSTPIRTSTDAVTANYVFKF